MSETHLSPQQIALLGALDDAELAELVAEVEGDETATPADREHLHSCAPCGAERARLDDLAERLRSTQGVGPMPADLADALTGRLSRTALWDPAAHRVLPLVRPTPGVRQQSSSQGGQRRQAWLLQAAAGISVLALAGALGVGAWRAAQSSSTSSSTSGASTGSLASAPTAAADGQSSPDAAALPALPALPSPPAAPLVVTASGTGYTAADVPRAVARLLLSKSDRATLRDASAAPATAAGLPPSCFAALAAGLRRTPVLVDSGTWQGRPVRLVVLRRTDDPHRGDAYVVAPTCRAGAVGTLFTAGVELP